MKKIKWIPVTCVSILLLGTVAGIFFSSKEIYGFWSTFLPSFLSNILGVSIAAILGVPIGLAVNRLYINQARQQEKNAQVKRFLVEAKNVKMEIESHAAIIQSLGQLCPVNPTALQQPIVNVNMLGYLLRDSEGKRVLSDRLSLELDEGLFLFNCGVYYHQLTELNQLITARAEQIQQYEAFNSAEAMKAVMDVRVIQQNKALAVQQLNLLDSNIHTKNHMLWTKNTEILRELDDVKGRLEKGLSK